MALTVGPRSTTKQGSTAISDAAREYSAFLSQMVSQKHDREKQQRSEEALAFREYAASHGGWSNVANSSPELLQHYFINVLGYPPEILGEAMKGVENGKSPDEMAWRLNKTLAFRNVTEGTGEPPPEGALEASPAGIPLELGFLDAEGPADRKKREAEAGPNYQDVVNTNATVQGNPDVHTTGYLAPRGGSPTPGPTATPAGDIRYTHLGYFYGGEEQLMGQAPIPSSLPGPGNGTGTPDPARPQRSTDDLAWEYMKVTYGKELGKNAKEHMDISKSSPALQEKYKEMQQALANVPVEKIKETITTLHKKFNTVVANDSNPSPGKQKAADIQLRNNAARVGKELSSEISLKELEDPGVARMYRDQVDLMQQQDPQRWAETFKDAKQTASDLTDMRYKDALAYQMQISSQIEGLKLKMAQSGDPLDSEFAILLELSTEYIKQPELAKVKQYDDVTTSVTAFLFNLFEADGKYKKQLAKGWFPWSGLKARTVEQQSTGASQAKIQGIAGRNQLSW